MTGKRQKKHKSCSSKKPDQAKSDHVKESTDLKSVEKSPQVNTFQSDENGGIMQGRPSLAMKTLTLVSVTRIREKLAILEGLSG